MEPHYHYATISEAISELRKLGFTMDFNLEENRITSEAGKFNADEFEIREVYRYEGESDPADEATVYGIESKSGLKGILVNSFGPVTDENASSILEKLTFHHA